MKRGGKGVLLCQKGGGGAHSCQDFLVFGDQPKMIMAGIQPTSTMSECACHPLPHYKHHHKSPSDDPGAEDYVNSRPLFSDYRPNIYSGGTTVLLQ